MLVSQAQLWGTRCLSAAVFDPAAANDVDPFVRTNEIDLFQRNLLRLAADVVNREDRLVAIDALAPSQAMSRLR